MSKKNVALKGSTILMLSLAYGCTAPGGMLNPASNLGPQGGAGLISNNAGGLISNNAGGLISNNAGGLISNNAGGLISNNAGGLISNNAGGLISNNAGGLTGAVRGPAAGLISNNAGGLISNNAGGLISNNAGGLISNNAGGYRTLAAADDANTASVASAKVAVFNERGEQVSYNWVTTDANGNYTFDRLKPSGPTLFVKAVYQQEGQQVVMMSTAPAPRKPKLLSVGLSPASTLVAKKVAQMITLRAVSVVTVKPEVVQTITNQVAAVMSPKAIVASVIFGNDQAAKAFDAMVKASPALASNLAAIGAPTLVATTPEREVQPAPGANGNTSQGGGSQSGGENSGTGGGINNSGPGTGGNGSGGAATPAVEAKGVVTTLTATPAFRSGNALGLAINGTTLYLPQGNSGLELGSLDAQYAVTVAPNPTAVQAVALDENKTVFKLSGITVSTLDGNQAASDPIFANATGLAIRGGYAYVSIGTRACIYKIQLGTANPAELYAGQLDGQGTADNANPLSATFKIPCGLSFDGNGNLFVADKGGYTVRKITPGGVVSTFAGNPSNSSLLNQPVDVTTDPQGNVYVAEYTGNKISKIAANGELSPIAGSGSLGATDNTGDKASFNFPSGIVYTTLTFGEGNSQNVLLVRQNDGKVRLIKNW